MKRERSFRYWALVPVLASTMLVSACSGSSGGAATSSPSTMSAISPTTAPGASTAPGGSTAPAGVDGVPECTNSPTGDATTATTGDAMATDTTTADSIATEATTAESIVVDTTVADTTETEATTGFSMVTESTAAAQGFARPRKSTTAPGTSSPDTTIPGTTVAATAVSGQALVGTGTIRLGIQLEPGTLDLTSDPSAGIPQVLLYNVYETLVRLDADGAIQPLLAESYDISDDGLTYTFKLRQGIKYHGGQDLTAEDVVYSITNVQKKDPPHPFKATFDPITSVMAVDDYTVELKLAQPSANLLFYLTQGQGVILDSQGAGDLAAGANGTGPFTFGEWVTGDHITLNRNDAYWGDPAKSAVIEYRYISDPNALANAMLAGDLEIVPNMSAPELMPQFEDNGDFVVTTGETYGEIVLSLNGRSGPLNNCQVRQAITMAIDSQGIVDATYGGYGTVIGTFSTPLDPYFKDNNDVYPYDQEKAKQLLAASGVSDITLQFVVPPTSYATRAAEIIQSQLDQIGIKVEITQLDNFGSWIDQVITKHDFDMSIVAHVEPKDLAQYGNPDYYWGNDSPEVAPILAQADAEPDEAKRNELYQQVLDDITADAADTWLYVLPMLSISKAGVQGYVPSALSLPMAGVSSSDG